MGLFYFDTHDLKYKSVSKKWYLYYLVMFLFIGFCCGAYSFNKFKQNRIKFLTKEEKLIIIHEHTKFSEDDLIAKIKELNIKFPHIVLGQAKLETGFFTSNIFRENNNLFGMREAKQRITTALGTENNHAYYSSWLESLYDYSFYQCRYLSNIQTEEQYFNYLEQSYAEDTTYVSKLKSIIKFEHLKDKF